MKKLSIFRTKGYVFNLVRGETSYCCLITVSLYNESTVKVVITVGLYNESMMKVVLNDN